MLYMRLAYRNLKKNRVLYLPFCIATLFTVVLNVIMQVILFNKGMDTLQAAASVKTMFGLGSVILVFFTIIFTFYTHSFLVKRRKKELGLYNILGMDKKNLATMMFFENVYLLFITLVVGLSLGVVLSKLMFLVLKRLTGFGHSFVYQFSFGSVGLVTLLFSCIFFSTFLYDAWEVRKAKPIELFEQEKAGEKAPKTNWLFSVIGVLCVGVGYWLSLTIQSPLSALTQFFVAVVLVIIGTYGLFIAGSVLLLKRMKSNERLYYQPNNFISIASMLFRMKQNGAGLATIAILCTMALVTLSSTACLYIGQETVIRNRNPFENSVEVALPVQQTKALVEETAQKNGVRATNVRYLTTTNTVEMAKKGKNEFEPIRKTVMNYDKVAGIRFLKVSEYNRLEKTKGTLAKKQAYVYPVSGTYQATSITFGNQTFHVKKILQTFASIPKTESVVDYFLIILPDEQLTPTFLEKIAAAPNASKRQFLTTPLTTLHFDLTGTADKHKQVANQLTQTLLTRLSKNKTLMESINVESRDADRAELRSLNGGFLFMGILFGISFLVATTLIIYYKQVSEGNDDRERFIIMQKVGLSHAEVKRTIQHQILLVFFLPIFMAVLHLSAAFPMIRKLLVLFGLTNLHVLLATTVGCVLLFSLGYFIIYWRTSKVYYRLVERPVE